METDHTGPESADHLDEELPKDSTHDKPSEETNVDDVHEADHLSEWDSDSTFDFDEEEWPICTPKVYENELQLQRISIRDCI